MKTNNKNVVRLTESQLKAMVAESVREALSEIGDTNHGQYMLGRLAGRKAMRGHSNSNGTSLEDVSKHAMANNTNGQMGRDYFSSGLSNYMDYSDPNRVLFTPALRYIYNDKIPKYYHDRGSEEMERLHAKRYMEYIPKSVKDGLGEFEEYPEHAHGAFGFYDKNGRYCGSNPKVESKNRNELSRLSESKLYKIVSESIDRVLKNK